MPRDRRIVITGVGPVASVGIGKDAFWKGLLAGRQNIREEEVNIGGEEWGKFPFHAVEPFSLPELGVDPDSLEWIRDWQHGELTRDLQYLIAAVQLALNDSGLDYRAGNNRIGLVVAHENYNLTHFLSQISDHAYRMLAETSPQPSKKAFYDSLYQQCVKAGYDVQPFMVLFHLAKVFNIHNYSLFVCTACASGLYGLESASQMIKSGQNDLVLVTAADHPDIYKYIWFQQLGIYAADGIIRPFCRDSKGLVFGAGGAALLLEEYRHAKKRGAHIYGEYLGGGFSLESWQVTVPQVGSDSYQTAMREALGRSGVTKDDVDFLCPHGVGSHVIDYYEAKAITDVFGKNPVQPLLTTFKPYVGHNLGGSALLEALILLLCLDKQTVLPTLNQSDPNPEYKISLLKEAVKKKVSVAMKTCCAFAGFNGAAVFRRI